MPKHASYKWGEVLIVGLNISLKMTITLKRIVGRNVSHIEYIGT